jgi:hypothetical protein
VTGQKPGCSPGVFCGDQIGFAKDPQRAERDVFKVADWRGDNEESAGHDGWTPAQACLERVVIVPSGDVRSRINDTERHP